jgi:SAM-dependent methyltransferase
MKLLVPSEGLQLEAWAHGLLPAVAREVADSDGMLGDVAGAHDHYLSVGASAVDCIRACMLLAGIGGFRSILDFGAGAGRVTRWLVAAWPEAAVSCADLREADLAFCAERFRATTFRSSTDIDAMAAPGRYDLIWVGSVLTHLDSAKAIRLIGKLLSWASPGGLVVMSTHGRFAHSQGNRYLHPGPLAIAEAEYRQSDYGYADYPTSPGYGVSFAKPAWIVRVLDAVPTARLTCFAERAWDRHHDIVALQAAG